MAKVWFLVLSLSLHVQICVCYVYICVHVCYMYICEGTACRSYFSPSTLWLQVLDLKLSTQWHVLLVTKPSHWTKVSFHPSS